jgi:hypothetical protein
MSFNDGYNKTPFRDSGDAWTAFGESARRVDDETARVRKEMDERSEKIRLERLTSKAESKSVTFKPPTKARSAFIWTVALICALIVGFGTYLQNPHPQEWGTLILRAIFGYVAGALGAYLLTNKWVWGGAIVLGIGYYVKMHGG